MVPGTQCFALIHILVGITMYAYYMRTHTYTYIYVHMYIMCNYAIQN